MRVQSRRHLTLKLDARRNLLSKQGMPVDGINRREHRCLRDRWANRREHRCLRDRWAYLARFLLLELWCVGQAVALRFLHGIRGGRSDRLHLTFRRTHLVEDGSEEQASSSRLPADSKKKPRGRLRVIGDRMLEHKGDLVALIHDWNVAMPDDPTMMRIPDPRENLFEFELVE